MKEKIWKERWEIGRVIKLKESQSKRRRNNRDEESKRGKDRKR